MALPPAAAAAPMNEEAIVEEPVEAVVEPVDTETELVLITKKNVGDEIAYMVYEGGMPEAPAEGEMAAMEGIAADSIGAALKAAMDILNADEEAAEGETAESNFAAGFEGGSEASPAKPAPMV